MNSAGNRRTMATMRSYTFVYLLGLAGCAASPPPAPTSPVAKGEAIQEPKTEVVAVPAPDDPPPAPTYVPSSHDPWAPPDPKALYEAKLKADWAANKDAREAQQARDAELGAQARKLCRWDNDPRYEARIQTYAEGDYVDVQQAGIERSRAVCPKGTPKEVVAAAARIANQLQQR